MAAKNEKEMTRHVLELARILKVVCTKMTRWYPSAEADDLALWATRELDALRLALEAE